MGEKPPAPPPTGSHATDGFSAKFGGAGCARIGLANSHPVTAPVMRIVFLRRDADIGGAICFVRCAASLRQPGGLYKRTRARCVKNDDARHEAGHRNARAPP